MIPTDKLCTYGKFIAQIELQIISNEGDYLQFHCGIEKN